MSALSTICIGCSLPFNCSSLSCVTHTHTISTHIHTLSNTYTQSMFNTHTNLDHISHDHHTHTTIAYTVHTLSINFGYSSIAVIQLHCASIFPSRYSYNKRYFKQYAFQSRQHFSLWCTKEQHAHALFSLLQVTSNILSLSCAHMPFFAFWFTRAVRPFQLQALISHFSIFQL